MAAVVALAVVAAAFVVIGYLIDNTVLALIGGALGFVVVGVALEIALERMDDLP